MFGVQESMPAFVSMVTMPFTFSIGYGIIGGLALWIAIQILLAPVRIYRHLGFSGFRSVYLSHLLQGPKCDIYIYIYTLGWLWGSM